MFSKNPALSEGIHAAVVVPFKEDYSIDDTSYRKQLDFVLQHEGVMGLLVNGHAGENSMTSDAEKAHIVRITRELAAPHVNVISGVYAEGSGQAVRQAQALEAAGADALLVFQPNGWALGAEPWSILTHHRMIHDGVATPIMLYQASTMSGKFAYSAEVLRELIQLQRVIGIKDGSWEIVASELIRDQIKAERPEITVFGSGDEHLMVNYFIGTEGSQVSLAAVVPGLICRLWEAAAAKDWEAAKECHRLIQPLAHLIYRSQPASRAVARLKACLTILGVIEINVVRPPMPCVPREEYRDLEAALRLCA